MKRCPLVIFLMGPTASGKTSLIIALKKHKLRMKIISVDSALVYKGMDIGTAKPSSVDLEYVPHKLIDIRDPAECYSVADFYFDAIVEIKKIITSGYIPVLVGGTMLYFNVLLNGLYCLPQTDYKIRNNLYYESQKIGWMGMYNKLKCIDPITSTKIHPNDHKRIIRALEIFLISGKTKTELQQHAESLLNRYQILQFAIMPSSWKILSDRIKQRFYCMLDNGFENEVKVLFSRSDLHKPMKSSISCIGYRQMWEYLSGNITYDHMIFKGVQATHRLAKNQLTWLRSWSSLFWINSDYTSVAVNEVLKILIQYSFKTEHECMIFE